MPSIKLTGLHSGVPIGFMAALGTFRHAAHVAEFGGVKLGWTPHGGRWCAVLHSNRLVESGNLIRLLLERVRAIGVRREFGWAVAVKSATKQDFEREARSAIQEARSGDHELADWFAAFGSDLGLDKEGRIASTPLDMTVARQQFLADAQWLTKSLAEPDKKAGDTLNAASFEEALFGPWKYGDDQHSLGWDPSTILMGAFTGKAPTAMSKAGVRAAVWLAMESLPFFPCFYQGNGLVTRGFKHNRRKLSLCWPIWTAPLSDVSIRSLISQTPQMTSEEWTARGVAAVYSSDIYKPNKYLTSFQPAVLTG